MKSIDKVLEEIASDDELLEVGRLAVEDALVEMRDSRIAVLGRRNGLVIAERDGTASSTIRLPTEVAVSIALQAIAKEIKEAMP